MTILEILFDNFNLSCLENGTGWQLKVSWFLTAVIISLFGIRIWLKYRKTKKNVDKIR